MSAPLPLLGLQSLYIWPWSTRCQEAQNPHLWDHPGATGLTMAMEGWSSEQILPSAQNGISFAQPSGGFASGANASIVMIAILYRRTLKLKEVNRPFLKVPCSS